MDTNASFLGSKVIHRVLLKKTFYEISSTNTTNTLKENSWYTFCG